MPRERLHRFLRDGRRFAIDVETCFCFECDDITWDLLEHYPHEPSNRIYHLLGSKHDPAILGEVIGELEWLRSTNSILPVARRADDEKWLRPERGLTKLQVDLRGRQTAAQEHVETAAELLIGRAQQQSTVAFEILVDSQTPVEAVRRAQSAAIRLAALSGKTLNALLRVMNVQMSAPELERHRLSIAVALVDDLWADTLSTLNRLSAKGDKPAAYAKALKGVDSARVTVHVLEPSFVEAVRSLHGAGFSVIELDLDAASVATGESVDLSVGFAETAAFYVERLQQHDYFRLEPVAELFQQIHQGRAVPRRDGTGAYALSVGMDGSIWPGIEFGDDAAYRAGSIVSGEFSEGALRPFDDVGSQTTAACRRCWARNVCGGGRAAVHRALRGSIHTPDEAWCTMQRRCIESAVGAFNDVAAAGIPFDRVHAQMGKSSSPSIFQLARAAFRSDIGLRPLAESDADMLRDWESWNRSAYFLLNERSVFIGNSYEREVDATQPRPGEFEMLVIRKGGAPAGLLRVRMTREAGLAEMYLYFRDDALYASSGVARSFRGLIADAAGGQEIRRIVTPVAPWETGLRGFLVRCGFADSGTNREALFTRGGYHDVHLMTTETVSS